MTNHGQENAHRRWSGLGQAGLGRRSGFAGAASIPGIARANRPRHRNGAAVFAPALDGGARDFPKPDDEGCPGARRRGLATLLAAALLVHAAAGPAHAEETEANPLLLPRTAPADGPPPALTPRIESDNCDPSPSGPAIHLGS
ncbi:hypothetical protein [Roseicyclus sp.]|uniref:hypothetical protein n=1 Tax=Roseicyclus sp. TaxID=1914329 RepID=UPI003FA067C5